MTTIARVSSVFFLLAAVSTVGAGCAVAADDEASTDEETSDEAAITASVAALAGTYESQGAARPPSFTRLALHPDRTFEATIDTGIRCVRAPCPSSAELWGTFTAGSKTLTLKAGEGADANGAYGRYKIERNADGFELTRTGANYRGWSDTLVKAPGIFPANATKLVAESPGGGFVPPPPPGSTCGLGKQKYTLDLATHELAWETCNYDPSGGPLKLAKGKRTLSASEQRNVTAAASAAALYTGDSCGADKPFLSVKVTTPSGTKTYVDAFYACQDGNRTYIQGIDDIFSAMRDLAK